MALALLASLRVAAAVPPSPAAQAGAAPQAAASAPDSATSAAPVPVASEAPTTAASAVPAPVASKAPAASSGAPSAHAASPAAATASDKVSTYPSPEGPREWMHGEDINWGRQITTTIVWLVLMCGAIYTIIRFMYGRAGFGALGFGPKRSIQILDRQMLGPQKALLTVRVPGKVLLLGMTDHTITALAELAPEDLESVTVAAPAPVAAQRPLERAAMAEAPPDNLVDLASLFGRRASQSSKGDDQE